MGRRSHTQALALWMNGERVGTWHLHPQSGDLLTYDPGWMAAAHGRPLSLSLPFMPGGAPHRGETVRRYFENLLPDSDDIRARIARRYQTTSTDAFPLLAEIGRDCVGALQLLPEGDVPAASHPVQATPLDAHEVAQVLRNAVSPVVQSQADDDASFRISIAGAQEKTALLRLNDRWCLPHGDTPTTHIFKLPLGLIGGMQYDMRESVDNEWLCALILKAYGLPVAPCEPLQFEDLKVLAVERFDRRWWQSPAGDARLVRLPQEDMCQARAVSPHAKYEVDGGPGIDSIMEVLEGSIDRSNDRRTFFEAQLVFWLLCATDGHAKNFSLFLHPGGRYRLTPLYDVLSAYPILGEGPGKLSPFKARMAMAVRSKSAHWKMREILRRHWVTVGERHGVTTRAGRDARFVIDELVERTPQVIRDVRAQLPPAFPPALAQAIFSGLQQAAHRLAD
ncbi:type II toxin-antitoxin system HipA family toxin [Variovorax ginsengisoli]|uniref:Serine/threonine-protein kinase HipA n=1 Tax=Variovorax ginsengisoli TaxID=363844 RepID=A0ABT9SAQ8_9BURK|nr:type II toxin-antitoxin system HipA family toxin [Variovorax ginsengisoli]MDP9900841.1 serine/threonine-protein kinase HipA [Variovorax ginsengisoli]